MPRRKRWAATVAGEPCKFGHTIRYLSNGRCVECAAAYWLRKYVSDPEKYRARARAAYRADPGKAMARAKQWKQANPERVREHNRRASRKYAEKNRKTIRAMQRAWRKAKSVH